jgi:RsiW-degrading membrane proteinase PrsW (M82 family)
MTNLEATLLGLFFGSLTGLVVATFFFYGRTLRQKHGKLSILLATVLVGGSAMGSIVLLAVIGDRFGVGRRSDQHYSSLYAFSLSFAMITVLTLRADLKWRKSLSSWKRERS